MEAFTSPAATSGSRTLALMIENRFVELRRRGTAGCTQLQT
jgi:hypothetical protein